MIISDLQFVEEVNVNEEAKVEGGIAYADAYAGAYAKGKYFAATYTSTYAEAKSGKWYSSASAGSYSSAVAY
ncbi:MAG: hypothetical protein Kow0049_03810 [Stanieria sp.]